LGSSETFRGDELYEVDHTGCVSELDLVPGPCLSLCLLLTYSLRHDILPHHGPRTNRAKDYGLRSRKPGTNKSFLFEIIRYFVTATRKVTYTAGMYLAKFLCQKLNPE
jgi:hypothetical protein